MFAFWGYLDCKSYAWASVWRIGLFVVSVVVFPFILYVLKTLTRCGHDTCGAVSLVGSMAFKPLAFALFTFSFAGISMRRARDAGVPGWVGLFIPLLFLADFAFLVFYAAPWSLGFSFGQLGIPVPQYALLAVGCIAVLSVLPPRDGTSGNPFGYAGWAVLGLGSFIGILAGLNLALGIPGLASIVAPLVRAIFAGRQILPLAMGGFFALLVWIAWREHGVQDTAHLRVKGPSASNLPVKTLAVIAAGLTLMAFWMSLPTGMSLPMVILVQLTPMVLPTFMLYLGVVAALYLAAKTRTLPSMAFLAIAVSPFVHWAYAHWSTTQQQQQEIREIAAIETTRVPNIPATLVIDSEHVNATRAAWKIHGIDEVILRGAYGSRLMQVTRPGPNDRWLEPKEISSLPEEYLELRIGRSSRFAKERQLYATAGGPLELRQVNASRNDLIAVWYRTYNPSPTLLPVLTTNGWFRGSNSASTDEVEASVATFLAGALPPARKG